MPILCNESLKYKIEIIRISSSVVMRLDAMRQRLILHTTNPELEISTSVSSLLLRIQRVELDVTFHNKLQLWNIFALSFDYLNHKLTMFLKIVASHFSQIFIYYHIYMRTAKAKTSLSSM